MENSTENIITAGLDDDNTHINQVEDDTHIMTLADINAIDYIHINDIINFSKMVFLNNADYIINILSKMYMMQNNLSIHEIDISFLEQDMEKSYYYLQYMNQSNMSSGIIMYNNLETIYNNYKITRDIRILSKYFHTIIDYNLYYNCKIYEFIRLYSHKYPRHLFYDGTMCLNKYIINEYLETIVLNNYPFQLDTTIIPHLKNIYIINNIKNTFTYKLPASIQYIHIKTDAFNENTINIDELPRLRTLIINSAILNVPTAFLCTQPLDILKITTLTYNYPLYFNNIKNIHLTLINSITDITQLSNVYNLILYTDKLTLYNPVNNNLYNFKNIRNLEIKTKEFNHVRAISFINLTNLREIIIITYYIKVNVNTFPLSLRKLTLYLYKCKEKIPNELFYHNKNLKYIDINLGKYYPFAFYYNIFPLNLETLIIRNYNIDYNVDKRIFPVNLVNLQLYFHSAKIEKYSTRRILKNIPPNIQTLALKGKYNSKIMISDLDEFKNMQTLDLGDDYDSYKIRKYEIDTEEESLQRAMLNKQLWISPYIQILHLPASFKAQLSLRKAYNLREIHYKIINPKILINANIYYYDIIKFSNAHVSIKPESVVAGQHNPSPTHQIIRQNPEKYKSALLTIIICNRRKHMSNLPGNIYRNEIMNEFILISAFKNVIFSGSSLNC